MLLSCVELIARFWHSAQFGHMQKRLVFLGKVGTGVPVFSVFLFTQLNFALMDYDSDDIYYYVESQKMVRI